VSKPDDYWLESEEEEAETLLDAKRPLLAIWYSGGFSVKEGRKYVDEFREAAKKNGQECVVLDHWDAYGIEGRGTANWPEYINRCIEEIDKEPHHRGRDLFLFGHSRGATAAVCTAAQLGSRVKKVYVVSTPGPTPGEESFFANLSEHFKAEARKGELQGDLALLDWFLSLDPANPVLRAMIASLKKGEITISDSPFLSEKLDVMKKQYREAMWPDMQRDHGPIEAPILVVSPALDPGAQPEGCQKWAHWTNGGFELESVRAGHMDIMANRYCHLYRVLLGDMTRMAQPKNTSSRENDEPVSAKVTVTKKIQTIDFTVMNLGLHSMLFSPFMPECSPIEPEPDRG